MTKHPMHSLGAVCLMTIAISVGAQTPPETDQGPPLPPPGMGPNRPSMDRNRPPMDRMRPPMERGRPPMERAFQGPPGRWWSDPALAQKLGLTADQQHRMDGIFQQNRLKLIDLSAALQKEEATLEPLLEAEHPDESKVVAQIDRIAQARGELEKNHARMLLGFRGVLNQDQWKKLQADRHAPGDRFPQGDRRPRD